MIELSESVEIDAPIADVWSIVVEPRMVASCIPGAAIERTASDSGEYEGTINVKFGPTNVSFRGQCSIVYDHEAHTCAIDGRGIDGKGASRALAHGCVRLAEVSPVTTALSLEGQYSVNGPLEGFANAGGVYVVRALLQKFAENIAVAAQSNDRHDRHNLVAERPSSLNAFTLLLKSLRAAVHSMLRIGVKKPT